MEKLDAWLLTKGNKSSKYIDIIHYITQHWLQALPAAHYHTYHWIKRYVPGNESASDAYP